MASPQETFETAKSLLKEKQFEEASALFEQAATEQGLNLDQMLQEAEQKMTEGKPDEAVEGFSQVMHANPTRIPALLGLARNALFVNMPEEAAQYLRAVLELDPENPQGHVFQGLVHEAQQEWDQALAMLNRAVELDESLFLAHYNLGRVLAQVGQLQPAFDSLLRATQLDDQSYDAFYMLGMISTKMDRLRDAIVSFNRAMEISPQQVDIYATLADVLVAATDYETALDVLNAGLNTCNEHPALLQKAAAVCSHAGKFGNAVEYMERVVEKQPDYYQAWINLALYYILTEDLEKSEEAAKRAIDIDPKDWQGYYHLGNLYETVKLFDKSEEYLRLAVDRAPKGEYRPLGNLGAVLIEMDDHLKNKEAITVLKKVIQMVEPGDWRFHYNLALVYGKLNRRGEAQPLLKQISENLSPSDPLYDAAAALEENLFSTQDKMKLNIALAGMSGDFRKKKQAQKDKNNSKDQGNEKQDDPKDKN